MLFSINTFSLARLNNQEYVGLMINVQKVLTDANRENLGFESSTLSDYNTLLQMLMDQVYSSQASLFTQQMKAADVKRNTIYKRLRMKLMAGEYVEEGSRLAKYSDVLRTEILSKYTGSVTQLPMQEETAVVSGLIYDLRDKLDDDAIEELGIEDDIAKLELANTAFVKAYNARATEKAEQETQRTILLRQKLNDVFGLICYSTQFYANSPAEKHKEMAPECQNVIKLMNVLLNEARQRLLQRLKQNSESDEEGNEAGQGGEGTGANGSGSDSNSNTGGSGNNTGNSGSNTGSNGGSGTNTGNDDFVMNDGTAEY